MRVIVAAIVLAVAAHSASAQSITRRPPVYTLQEAGATSATPGTFTVALPQGDGTRSGCSVVNTGATVLSVYLRHPGASVGTVATALPIAPGATYRCFDAEQSEISVASSTASASYILQSE